jgi:TRAP-type C4-dicarboxylate transport system permease small subunit
VMAVENAVVKSVPHNLALIIVTMMHFVISWKKRIHVRINFFYVPLPRRKKRIPR